MKKELNKHKTFYKNKCYVRYMLRGFYLVFIVLGLAALVACDESDEQKANAHLISGLQSLYGYETEQSDDNAFGNFIESARSGGVEAMYYVGTCYLDGRGIEQSYEKAFDWFSLAAYYGSFEAKMMLAVCYYQGLGVEKSKSEGDSWAESVKEYIKSWQLQDLKEQEENLLKKNEEVKNNDSKVKTE